LIGLSIEEALKNWWVNPLITTFKSLLAIIAWALWLVRNNSLFEDKFIIHFRCASPRQIENEIVDRETPRDYFDGVA
jgi:hypothetical protein